MSFGRCVIVAELMAAWSRKTWKFVEQFLRFFWKNDPLRYNFQNSVPKVFTGTPIDVVLFKFREMSLTGNRPRWNRASFRLTWPKNSASSQTVATARMHPKSARCRFHPNPFTFSGVIAERVNTVFAPLSYFHYSPEAKRSFWRIINLLKLSWSHGPIRLQLQNEVY